MFSMKFYLMQKTWEDILNKIEKVNRTVDPPIILIFNLSQLAKFFDLVFKTIWQSAWHPCVCKGSNIDNF